MKIVRFTENGKTSFGKLVDEEYIVDLSRLSGIGSSMRQLLNDLPQLRASLVAADGPMVPRKAVKLDAPVNDPQKFLGIGMNYKAHAEEARAAGIAERCRGSP